MSSEQKQEWPPEGTRVRIRHDSIWNGREGDLVYVVPKGWSVDVTPSLTVGPFQRHEIEVIDE